MGIVFNVIWVVVCEEGEGKFGFLSYKLIERGKCVFEFNNVDVLIVVGYVKMV